MTYKRFEPDLNLLSEMKAIIKRTTDSKYPDNRAAEILDKIFLTINGAEMFDVILALAVMVAALDARGPEANNGVVPSEQVEIGAKIFALGLSLNAKKDAPSNLVN